MTKVELVMAKKADLVAAQDAALQAFGEACFDGGVAAVPTEGFSQADVDAAVAAAVAPINAQIEADKAALTDLHSQLDAAISQDQVDKQALVDFKAKIAALLS